MDNVTKLYNQLTKLKAKAQECNSPSRLRSYKTRINELTNSLEQHLDYKDMSAYLEEGYSTKFKELQLHKSQDLLRVSTEINSNLTEQNKLDFEMLELETSIKRVQLDNDISQRDIDDYYDFYYSDKEDDSEYIEKDDDSEHSDMTGKTDFVEETDEPTITEIPRNPVIEEILSIRQQLEKCIEKYNDIAEKNQELYIEKRELKERYSELESVLVTEKDKHIAEYEPDKPKNIFQRALDNIKKPFEKFSAWRQKRKEEKEQKLIAARSEIDEIFSSHSSIKDKKDFMNSLQVENDIDERFSNAIDKKIKEEKEATEEDKIPDEDDGR